MSTLALRTDEDRDQTAWRTACIVTSAICLSIAIHVRDGLVHPGTILWLSLSLVTALAAFIRRPATSILARHAPGAIGKLIGAGIALNFVLLYFSYIPGGHGPDRPAFAY